MERKYSMEVPTIHHWPTLRTVLSVEKALMEADETICIEELKRRLPTRIMDQTLRLILTYLEDKGMILIGEKGILWIENNDPKFIRMIEKSKGIELH
ncbi:MAG: hypothetical protein U9M95_03820 [Candidatus Altiarchaeota archaeon]|nr:hypothetical protein [Candidatus Altiarchaeota archaeon]